MYREEHKSWSWSEKTWRFNSIWRVFLEIRTLLCFHSGHKRRRRHIITGGGATQDGCWTLVANWGNQIWFLMTLLYLFSAGFGFGSVKEYLFYRESCDTNSHFNIPYFSFQGAFSVSWKYFGRNLLILLKASITSLESTNYSLWLPFQTFFTKLNLAHCDLSPSHDSYIIQQMDAAFWFFLYCLV